MSMRQSVVFTWGLIAATLLCSVALYPHLPDPMPIHWNIRGEVDGWCPKWQGAFLLPAFMALLFALLQYLPRLHVKYASVTSFRSTYNYICALVVAMMAYVHAIILLAAMNQGIDLLRVLTGGLYLFCAALGNVLGKLQPNRWAGIRTPWTMQNRAVWVGTHRFAARIWTPGSLIAAAAAWLGAPFALTFSLLIPLLLAPIPYSYILYKRLGN